MGSDRSPNRFDHVGYLLCFAGYDWLKPKPDAGRGSCEYIMLSNAIVAKACKSPQKSKRKLADYCLKSGQMPASQAFQLRASRGKTLANQRGWFRSVGCRLQ